MKSIILILSLVSSNVFAGGSVGTMSVTQEWLEKHGNGGGTIDLSRSEKTILFNYGYRNGKTSAAVGSLQNNQWIVNQIELPSESLNSPELLRVLDKSLKLKDWVVLGN